MRKIYRTEVTEQTEQLYCQHSIAPMNNEIAFLVPYFGKLPSYFDAFLQSVANKNFDVFFFTDYDQPKELPANCKWHHYSFNQLQQRLSEKLQLNIAFKNPRKLCDFKPALGLIFQDYIKQYNFWGSIDLDLCVGNFEKYGNKSILETADVFSGIKEYVSGSCFMVRNTAYHNSLFKKSKDWQTVFLTEKYMGFDECGGRFFRQLKAGKTFAEIQPLVESFTEVLFNEPQEQTRLYFKDIIAEPEEGISYVDADKVIYDEQEYLLVHYISYKSARTFYTNKKVRFPFYINRFGFFKQRPTFLVILFSKNFRIAVLNKIKNEIKKFVRSN